ncbi:lipopolysaccharide transport periplasmic protein LptA [Paludibacterium purpuratum]|uniref:Lipopolysaccharide export system protein LptA n=1 Tax=Paludibacterium purpuratum TaxID=1144873 RepID=A0A4R7BCF7_9NEIS|nr:lipopolysaccharide transport periplasmic protein LptA [Paludibacterium purpuratum]TDR81605.1 lipopolysaccharide export system protein LptA [Paludibacterium purpuratum]
MSNKFAALLIPLALTAPLAHAEKADADKPIQISADRASLDQLKGITQWDGAVVVIQGTLLMHSDHLTVTRDAQGNQTMVATGKLVTFRQKADDTPEKKNVWIDGQANRIDYSTVNHTAVLTTNARVKKDTDLLIGDVIVYNTETQIYQSQGGGTNTANKGRVTAIIQPQKKNASNGAGKQP